MAEEFIKLCDTISNILDELIENDDLIEQTHRTCTVSFFIKHLQKANVLKDELNNYRLPTIEHWDVTSPEGKKLMEVARDGQVIWKNPNLTAEEIQKLNSMKIDAPEKEHVPSIKRTHSHGPFFIESVARILFINVL